MDGRPPKRIRRSKDAKQDEAKTVTSKRRTPAPAIIPDSSSPIESPSEPFALSSRPKPSYSRGPTPTTQFPSSSPSPNKKAKPSPKPDSKSKSLHSFFQPATEGQRWAPQNIEKQSLPPVKETVDVDPIEDDYDSYDEIFTQHLANERAGTDLAAVSSSQTRRPAPKPKAPVKPPRKTTKKFLLATDSRNPAAKEPLVVQPAGEPDRRPWAQRFAPASLGELAVHKKKVSDVQHWLEGAFAGRRSEVSSPINSRMITGWIWHLALTTRRGYLSYGVRQGVGRQPLYLYSLSQSDTILSSGGIPRSQNMELAIINP
jgi:cell cycle checkpoint protein